MSSLPDEAEEFEVWPENWCSLNIFLACSSQWNINFGNRKIIGLRYVEVEAVMRMSGIGDTAKTFADVRIMEHAAMTELNREI